MTPTSLSIAAMFEWGQQDEKEGVRGTIQGGGAVPRPGWSVYVRVCDVWCVCVCVSRCVCVRCVVCVCVWGCV